MFVAIGIGFAWGATNYSFGSSARPGPGYFPFGLGVMLALPRRAGAVQGADHRDRGRRPDRPVAWKPLLVMLGAVALFGWLLLPRLGMILTLPVLVVISAWPATSSTRRGLLNAAC
jgi:hypothetical protein